MSFINKLAQIPPEPFGHCRRLWTRKGQLAERVLQRRDASLVGLIKYQVLTNCTHLPQPIKVQLDGHEQTTWELLTMPGPKVGHWGTRSLTGWSMKVAACATQSVSHMEEWVTESRGGEGEKRPEEHTPEPRREGQQGAERRGGKGGQREAGIRESKSKRSKEGPRPRQVGSRAPGAWKASSGFLVQKVGFEPSLWFEKLKHLELESIDESGLPLLEDSLPLLRVSWDASWLLGQDAPQGRLCTLPVGVNWYPSPVASL